MQPEVHCARITTDEGKFDICYSAHGVCRLEFPHGGRAANPGVLEPLPAGVRQWHAMATVALRQMVAGVPDPLLPPLDLSSGTSFQQSVWKGLLRIPWGQVRSYAEVAREIGSPRAARAVGMACGANPIPVFVPCHRVVAAGHKLGGFSGGLHWKTRLLASERVLLTV